MLNCAVVVIQSANMVESSDNIIDGLRNGDKSVFETVYREYFAQLCYFCVKYVDNFEDAEGIVQDVFVKLWNRHEDIEINVSLKAYLYRAVQNYALNFLKKKKIKDKYIVINANLRNIVYDSGLLKMEENEFRVILKHAILKLPEKRRKIFELSRFSGYKYSKIADELSISVKTVEAQMTKALKYLRIVLKDYAPVLLLYCLINSIL